MNSQFIFVTVFILLLSNGLVQIATAQDQTQTLRGRVKDIDSQMPIIGATVVLMNSNPIIGVVTDVDGSFKLENIPVGRQTLKIDFLGYEPRIIPNLLVVVGKETVLNIELTESAIQMDEIVVLADATRDKTESLNEMAVISARGFTVEETKRYAGSFDDPARMASAYAGVSGDPSGNNDIIIRGNSPRGLLWRVEGIEIPNPNHFSNEGASGGPISILNSNILSDSDFFTGAFPAEFGNAYSGVFDIKLRKGNNQKREHAFQMSLLGLDASSEGYFRKDGKSSYLVNYRYSSLAALTAIGVKVAGDNIPKYQDGAFKLSFPTQKAGEFTVFGVGGVSGIDEAFENNKGVVNDKGHFGAGMGVVGIKNRLSLGNKTYLETTISGSRWFGDYENEILDEETKQFRPEYKEAFFYSSARASIALNHKINAKNKIQTGVIYSHLFYDMKSNYYDTETSKLKNYIEDKGDAGYFQGYASWKYRVLPNLTLNSGVHFLKFNLNGNYSVEPRAGIKWQLNPKHAISAGFGIHSRLDPVSTYLAFIPTKISDNQQLNKNIKMSKARHYVLGYHTYLTDNLHLNIEAYYQDLYDVAVSTDPEEAHFSMLNLTENFVNTPLKNRGTGKNYGVELTFERFFANDYYFLVTGSIYDSKYTDASGKVRNTAYNGNFATNFLGGKEFDISRKGRHKKLIFSTKLSYAGGNRTIPIDLNQSILENETVRIYERAFEVQNKNFTRWDLQIGVRTDRGKTTRTFKLDIQNILNAQNTVYQYFDADTQGIEAVTQLGFLPNISYKIEF